MLVNFHTLFFLKRHDNPQPTGRRNEVTQQKHVVRCVSAQINYSGKLKATRNRTKIHQVNRNYKEQLMILAKPLVGMAEYR